MQLFSIYLLQFSDTLNGFDLHSYIFVKTSPAICHAGCGTITSICLRMPDNAKQVMDAGGAQLLIQVLKNHHQSSSKVAVSIC